MLLPPTSHIRCAARAIDVRRLSVATGAGTPAHYAIQVSFMTFPFPDSQERTFPSPSPLLHCQSFVLLLVFLPGGPHSQHGSAFPKHLKACRRSPAGFNGALILRNSQHRCHRAVNSFGEFVPVK
ncbi:hypothetical protein K438DRAFT_1153594 [Mycena galopus ATCC 62051]|nr:hypothetical protein K438DRAFT_1153594 [Mycena galopus ATCC 62051]